MWSVYKIENRLTGKCYIGITGQSIGNRWRVHYSEAKCGTRMRTIHRALAKYGLESFTFAIIGRAATASEAKQMEIMAIKVFGSLAPGGYNLTAGGDGTESPAEETRERMRAAQTGRKQSVETIERRAKSLAGRKRNPESVQKSAAARRGVKRSEEFRAACRERAKKQFSDVKARERISVAMADKWRDPAYREAMMAARSGAN